LPDVIKVFDDQVLGLLKQLAQLSFNLASVDQAAKAESKAAVGLLMQAVLQQRVLSHQTRHLHAVHDAARRQRVKLRRPALKVKQSPSPIHGCHRRTIASPISQQRHERVTSTRHRDLTTLTVRQWSVIVTQDFDRASGI